MDWQKIKDFIIEHKQYFLVGLIVVGIVIWTRQGSDLNNHNADFTVDSTTTKTMTKKADTTQPTKITPTDNVQPKEKAKPENVTCDISGAVKHQGVYTLKTGARLQELIDAAGGTTARAQLKQVNRALILQDQDKVHIPYYGEKIKASEIVIAVNNSAGEQTAETTAASDSTATASDNQTNAKININTANAEELQKLNGIGEKKAEQIIAYRQKSGNFKKIEDLKQVSGIGDKTFAALKDQLAV
ncbi:helix-hairpin-helix domain-containing protein [Lactobacillus sp. ESL0785]|uniref:helix-hairpin-helix domain-containing protein n=1 Tax=Lactobacillus sp. ESL0785 TaxID=2983232 RepID=UPI0023F8F7C9|nr:helix-hairpin-helix domain-containing protein [Lactobacillus sp. ESL0785]WEV71550.1 helix-hairpin-helix domain-containing protein [Lactobacillus sp. ESL0785]